MPRGTWPLVRWNDHMAEQTQQALAILRRKQVEARTGLPTFHHLREDSGRRISGPSAPGARCVGWIEAEVAAWLEARVAASREGSGGAA